jgi:hypothetical protein
MFALKILRFREARFASRYGKIFILDGARSTITCNGIDLRICSRYSPL